MAIGKYVKAPDERKRYELDYADWLDDGETVVSVTFSATPVTLVSPLVVDDAEVTPDSLGLQFYVSGGEVGVAYDVVAELTTSGGQVKDDVIKFVIKDPA